MNPGLKEAPRFERSIAIDYWLYPGEEKFLQDFTSELGKIDDPREKMELQYTALFMLTANHRSGDYRRDDGSPRSSHSLEAAMILSRLGLLKSAIGRQAFKDDILHDIGEDTEFTIDDLRLVFGDTTADDLELISRVKKPDGTEADEQERDKHLRKGLLTGLEERLPAFLARISERLHNLRTITARFDKDPESAERTCRETLDVYLPPLEDSGLRKEFADEMGKISLGLLYPNLFADLDSVLPVFNPEKRRVTADKLADVLDIRVDREEAINVTAPSYHKLWRLLKLGFTPERIRDHYGAKIPFDIDLQVADHDFKQIGNYLGKIITSAEFGIASESLAKVQKLVKSPRHEEPISVLVGPSDGNSDSSYFRLSFLTPEQFKEKQASLIDYLVSDDSELASAAERKLNRVRQMMAEVIGQDTTRELEYFSARLEDTLINVTYEIDGKLYEHSLPAGSTYLDLMADFLPESDFLHLRTITSIDEEAEGEKRNLLLSSDPIRDGERIALGFDRKNITARPFWLDKLGPSIELRRNLLRDIFRKIIKGEIPNEQRRRKNFLQVRKAVSEGARLRGERMLAARMFDRTLEVSVTHGFDDELKGKYTTEPFRFLEDVGLEDIELETIDAVAGKLNKFKKTLVNLIVGVPIGADRAGWLADVSGAISASGINIASNNSYGIDKPGASAEIVFKLQRTKEMAADKDTATVMTVLQTIIKRACLEQLGSEPSYISFEF